MIDALGITIPRLLDLQALEADLVEQRYRELAIPVNHATQAPDEVNKRLRAQQAPRRESHRPAGRAAIPRSAYG